MKNKFVVGVINFSTLCKKNSGSFISSRENSWEEHVNKILGEDRLITRINFLTKISIPLLDQQKQSPSKNWFRLVIIISKLIPDKFKSILYQVASERPWLVVEERSEDDWLDATGSIKRALNSMLKETKNDNKNDIIFASFRLDDDDFLSVNYLSELCKEITAENIGKFVTFPNGYKCLWNDDKIKNLIEVEKPLIAIGLAHIGTLNTQNNEFSSTPATVFAGVNHYELGKNFPIINITSPPMYVWSQHNYQDTAGRFKSSEINGAWQSPPENIFDILANFPALREKL